MDTESFQRFIDKVCDDARAVAVRYFNAPPSMERKADLSPVTQADRDIEMLIVDAIGATFPEHDIIGEEFGERAAAGAPGQAGRFTWIVDPIDGTGSFAIGNPLFGTLIGLLRDDAPWMGVIDMPILRERLTGGPAGALRNGASISTSDCSALAAARLCTTSPEIFDSREAKAFDRIASVAVLRRYGGDCYNYALLAMGRVDLVVEAGLQPYDYLPLVPIIEAAGGVVTDWQGGPLQRHSSGQVVAAANAVLHREAIELLNG